MNIYYGCDEVPKGWDRYFEAHNAIELHLDGDQPPNTQTLNRWRVQSPKGFAFIVHLPESVAKGLIVSEQQKLDALPADAQEALDKTLEQANALAAKALYLSTNVDFGPNEENRERIAKLAKLARDQKRTLIWEPQGMWPQEHTYTFCRDHHIMLAIDPFLWEREGYQRAKASDVCIVLTERASARRKFDQYDMEDMIDSVEGAQRVFILCRGRFKWDHLRELRYTLEYVND